MSETLNDKVDQKVIGCESDRAVKLSNSVKSDNIENDTTNSSTETEKNVTSLIVPLSTQHNDETSENLIDEPVTVRDSITIVTTADVNTTLSKNQLKKRRRQEKAIQIKQRKKQQNKQVRYERAKAQGRDIDMERKQQEQARLVSSTNENRIKRYKFWEEHMIPKIQSSFQVCIDCSYESLMTPKEINSLAIQIRYCYSSNKRSTSPCQLTATSIGNKNSDNNNCNGKNEISKPTTTDSNENHPAGNILSNTITLNHLKNVNGFDEWSNWGFVVTCDSFETHFQNCIQNVVYLTSDSDNTIQTLENDKIYVIGGIVDRNRLKRITIDRATRLGIATAKLPIDEYLSEMPSTRVLTTNHVFDLLLKYKLYNGNWKKALEDVLPQRKDAKFLDVDDKK